MGELHVNEYMGATSTLMAIPQLIMLWIAPKRTVLRWTRQS